MKRIRRLRQIGWVALMWYAWALPGCAVLGSLLGSEPVQDARDVLLRQAFEAAWKKLGLPWTRGCAQQFEHVSVDRDMSRCPGDWECVQTPFRTVHVAPELDGPVYDRTVVHALTHLGLGCSGLASDMDDPHDDPETWEQAGEESLVRRLQREVQAVVSPAPPE